MRGKILILTDLGAALAFVFGGKNIVSKVIWSSFIVVSTYFFFLYNEEA